MSTIRCPSGMVVEVRELTGRDGRYLTNPKLVRDNEVEDWVLRNCTTLVEAGPYEARFKGNAIDWGKTLVGDRAFLFIAIREETFPSSEEPFYFKVPCVNGACKNSDKPFEWGIDLARLMRERMKPLTPEAAETFLNGNRFEASIPFAKPPRKFWFKLKTGDDAKRMALLIEQRNSLSKRKQEEVNRLLDTYLASIIEIEGIDKNRVAMTSYLEDLSFRSLDALLPIIQGPDCGIETGITVRCPKCSTRRAIDLPFDRTFFLPKSSKLSAESRDSDDDEAEEVPSVREHEAESATAE